MHSCLFSWEEGRGWEGMYQCSGARDGGYILLRRKPPLIYPSPILSHHKNMSEQEGGEEDIIITNSESIPQYAPIHISNALFKLRSF